MLNQLFTVATFLLVVLSFSMGFFSLGRNSKSFVVKMWFGMNMAVGLWSAGLLLVLFSETPEKALVYSRILHVGAAFIPIFFCHFVLAFLYRARQMRTFLIIGYVLAMILAGLSLTDWIVIRTASVSYFHIWLVAGPAYPLLLAYFWFYVLATIYFLIQGYRRSDGVMKRKTFYILIAAIIGFVGGGTNFLPQTVGIYPYGHFLTWLYPLLITYGIFFDEIKLKVISNV